MKYNNNDNDIYKCTQCKNEFKDGRYMISLNVEAQRLTSNETFEDIGNLDQTTKEILCSSCFDKFIDTLSKFSDGDTDV